MEVALVVVEVVVDVVLGVEMVLVLVYLVVVVDVLVVVLVTSGGSTVGGSILTKRNFLFLTFVSWAKGFFLSTSSSLVSSKMDLRSLTV